MWEEQTDDYSRKKGWDSISSFGQPRDIVLSFHIIESQISFGRGMGVWCRIISRTSVRFSQSQSFAVWSGINGIALGMFYCVCALAGSLNWREARSGFKLNTTRLGPTACRNRSRSQQVESPISWAAIVGQYESLQFKSLRVTLSRYALVFVIRDKFIKSHLGVSLLINWWYIIKWIYSLKFLRTALWRLIASFRLYNT